MKVHLDSYLTSSLLRHGVLVVPGPQQEIKALGSCPKLCRSHLHQRAKAKQRYRGACRVEPFSKVTLKLPSFSE